MNSLGDSIKNITRITNTILLISRTVMYALAALAFLRSAINSISMNFLSGLKLFLYLQNTLKANIGRIMLAQRTNNAVTNETPLATELMSITYTSEVAERSIASWDSMKSLM